MIQVPGFEETLQAAKAATARRNRNAPGNSRPSSVLDLNQRVDQLVRRAQALTNALNPANRSLPPLPPIAPGNTLIQNIQILLRDFPAIAQALVGMALMGLPLLLSTIPQVVGQVIAFFRGEKKERFEETRTRTVNDFGHPESDFFLKRTVEASAGSGNHPRR